MDFTNAPGFRVFWYTVMVIVWRGLMKALIKSAMNSLKRTGGKLSSVFDEVIVGIIVSVGFIIVAMQSPSTIISWLSNILKWVWNLLLSLLRFVGLPV